MKFSEINTTVLLEGINDAGIFKCIFLAGLPGSGKSTIAKKLINACNVHPKIVDFDRFYEYLSMKQNVDIDDNINKDDILSRAEFLTREQLTHYVNNMLPIIIDGTAVNPTAMLNRIDILHTVGYDIGMIYVKTALETSLSRAAKRDRYVDPEFIRQAHSNEEANIQYLSERIPTQGGGPFIIIDNDDYSDTIKQTNKFFNSKVQNKTGVKYMRKIKALGGKTLAPNAYDNIDDVGVAVSKWTSKTR